MKKFLRFSCALFFLYSFNFSIVFAAEKPQLIFSIDLIRHGDRTPVQEIPNSPYSWEKGLGELTPLGKKQEFNLGRELREQYIQRYHLLPSHYRPETLYARSTKMNRTIQSAESLLMGLYPLDSRTTSPIPIHTVELEKDHLLEVHFSKNIISKIRLYFYTRKLWKEKIGAIQDKIEHWRKATGLPLTDFQQFCRLGDNLYIRKLHHIPLPHGITDQDANTIISLGQWIAATAYKRKEISYPTGHKFLTTVVADINQAIQGKNSLKYILFSGHDSSIMSVMNTLGTPLEKSPAYASRLNFSLFKDNGNYYVKVSMNNKPVIVPGCEKDMCLFSTFSRAVR
jgi:acid phosphatase